MPTECSDALFEFPPAEGRQVVAALDGGTITSDAGALLLGAADRVVRLTERFAACFTDRRKAAIALTETVGAINEDALAGYFQFAEAIGRHLGELHALLAKPSEEAEFAPEPVTSATAEAWANTACAELDAARRTIAGLTLWKEERERSDALALDALVDALRGKIHDLAKAAPGTLSMRIHGDFHLGQVLVAQGDAVLIDFEGEPAKGLAERRAKGSPFRDVAGLLRSFDYAAATLAREPAPAAEAMAERRDDLLHRFIAEASAHFTAGYRAAAQAAPYPWAPDAATGEALTDLFLIQKAAYEINYEAANRPGWIGIPLAGLVKIAQRLVAGGESQRRPELVLPDGE